MENVLETTRNELKNWWWFLVVGVLSLAAGIAIFARPVEGYASLSILFSLVMAGTGLSQIVFALSVRPFMRGWGWSLVSGIVDLAIGTYLLMHPAVTMVTLPYFVGFYLLFRAFYLMGVSFDLNSFGVPGWGWLLVGGILLLALGFLTLYYPAAGVAGIVAVSGSAFIVSGVFSMVLAFQLRGIKQEFEPRQSATGRITTPRGEAHHHTT